MSGISELLSTLDCNSTSIYISIGIIVIFLINSVLLSVGLYGVAKKHGIKGAGFAWLPIARQWVKGSIVDYHSQKTKWRTILPIFAVLSVLQLLVMCVAILVLMIIIWQSVFFYFAEEFLPSLVVSFVLCIAAFVVMIVNYVSNIICDYKLFEEVYPKRAYLFTLLSYAVPLARGICLVVCTKYGTGETEVLTPSEDVSNDTEIFTE